MKYIFITGVGRSGTALLANIFKHISNVSAYHEFIGNREYATLSWYLPGDVYAIPYLSRQKKIILAKFDCEYFIEVNSCLRNSVPELKKIFSPESVFHLVRDGRDTIRSIYSRRSIRRVNQIPKKKDLVEWWLDSDKFEQICWNWATATKTLLSQDTRLIQLEKIISDYDYFNKTLLSPFSFVLPKAQWKAIVSKKVNRKRSKLYRFLYAKLRNRDYVPEELAHYSGWTGKQKKIFWDICGEVMELIGYKYEG